MSYGDTPTTLYFNKSPTTLIVGKNGSGKSSWIEAFVFAIKGNTYRGSNKNDLINKVNQRDCLVELHFTKNNSKYIITRGIKPNVFFIEKDGIKIEESASIRDMQAYLETQVLQTSVTGIIKTGVLGCDFKPFMMMSAKEKRDLIETLLEINVFTEMNKLLKKKITAFREEYTEHQNMLKIKEGILEAKKELVQQLKDNTTKNSEKEKEELKQLKSSIEALEASIDAKNEVLKGLVPPHDASALKTKIGALTKEINELEYDNTLQTKQIKKFSKMSGECGECGQDVSDEHKESHISKAKALIDVNNIKLSSLNEELETYKAKQFELDTFTFNKTSLTQEITALLKNLEHIKETAAKRVKSYKETLKNESVGIEKHKEDYDQAKIELKQLKEMEKDFIKRKHVFNLAAQLLKDEGIKATIVNQYIPVLVQSVNYYLQSLNSPIRFNMDKNLDVTLDARTPGDFSYHTLSMGERQRIDLSISFAWRKVASIKNSVNTNLLFLDETFDASVDSDGTDDLLLILDDIQKAGVNIFVISHKGGLEDKLRSTIKIEKKNGFSRICV